MLHFLWPIRDLRPYTFRLIKIITLSECWLFFSCQIHYQIVFSAQHFDVFFDPYSKIIDSDTTLSHRTINSLNNSWSSNVRNWHTLLMLTAETVLSSGSKMHKTCWNLTLRLFMTIFAKRKFVFWPQFWNVTLFDRSFCWYMVVVVFYTYDASFVTKFLHKST